MEKMHTKLNITHKYSNLKYATNNGGHYNPDIFYNNNTVVIYIKISLNCIISRNIKLNTPVNKNINK